MSGRPTAYKEEFAKQAKKLSELGATDQETADFFEVDVRTVYRWKHSHDEFCQALKSGKSVADERVELCVCVLHFGDAPRPAEASPLIERHKATPSAHRRNAVMSPC